MMAQFVSVYVFICLSFTPPSVFSSRTVNWSLSCTRCPGCGVRPRQSLRCEMSQWDTSCDLRLPLRAVSSLPFVNPHSHVWNIQYKLSTATCLWLSVWHAYFRSSPTFKGIHWSLVLLPVRKKTDHYHLNLCIFMFYLVSLKNHKCRTTVQK